MIFRQKKIKKKQKIFKIIILQVDFVPQSQHPLTYHPKLHISPQTPQCHPKLHVSSRTPNVIPNAALLRTHLLRRMIRDLIIVPQNRSFQASLSGHPPRRRKLLLRWTAPQAFQSLPLHKKFYACRKYKEKLHQTSKQNQRAFAQNRMYKNVHFNRKPIFFLRSESRRSRLTRVPYWCQRFSYTIKMCSPKTPSHFREVIQPKRK